MNIISPTANHRKALLGLFCSLDRIGQGLYLQYSDLESVDEAIKNHQIRIAVDDEKIVGAIVMTPRDTCLYIEALIVKARKRRRGIGTKLLKEAIKRAKKLDKPKVIVETAFVYDAKKFYRKCGFQRTRTWDDSWTLIYRIEKSNTPATRAGA